MIYSEAWALLRQGYRARRAGWPQGAYVFLAAGGRVEGGKTVREVPTRDETSSCVFVLGPLPPAGACVLPALCYCDAAREITVGWSLPAGDLIADDWQTRS